MRRSLSPESTHQLATQLRAAHAAFAARYPGETGHRQPVHTFYGGAHLFKADTCRRLGEAAIRILQEFAPDFVVFAKAAALPGATHLPDPPSETAKLAAYLKKNPQAARSENRAAWLAHTIYERVIEKLRREPVEDFRIDFEDGYGNRPDSEEDGHAAFTAEQIAIGMAAGQLPPFVGIRIKPLSEELRERSIRTLDIFLTTLLEKTGGRFPASFVVTLPKVSLPEEVAALADILELLEAAHSLAKGSLRLELMVETPQAILDSQGRCSLPHLVSAACGRCVAAHFGTYDYTASCSLTAAHQHMLHPACDFARHMMQVALAGTGIWLSDGATNILPVPPHRTVPGATLTAGQVEENRRAVHRAWKLHYEHIQHSLSSGFYQGWDLHPAQLPTRYAAVYAFFLEDLEAVAERLRNFVDKAAQTTLVGEILDDAATGQGLLNYFLRALNCGAITEPEAQELTGLTLHELRAGSFLRILKNRQERQPGMEKPPQ